jgi:anti-sigma regulatory factor (Ser/Thr protein kinase)
MNGAVTGIFGELRLELPANASCPGIARRAVEGFLVSLDLSPEVVSAVKLAVTEACSNVVLHAYPEGEGTCRLEASWTEPEFVLRVTDTGVGIEQPSANRGLGVGLDLMASVADVFEAGPGDESGTVLAMRFLD